MCRNQGLWLPVQGEAAPTNGEVCRIDPETIHDLFFSNDRFLQVQGAGYGQLPKASSARPCPHWESEFLPAVCLYMQAKQSVLHLGNEEGVFRIRPIRFSNALFCLACQNLAAVG